MTCIVGLAHEGVVYIGGDSAGVADDWGLTVRADSKVFQNGPFLIGFSSSFRMGQLLRYAFEPPVHAEGVSVEKYMATTFVDAVRDCLKAGGYAHKENEVEAGGVFIVGYRGRLFQIDSDYQVGVSADPYTAIGCGALIALGSLYATERRGVVARSRVTLALEAAERHSAGVRGPFTVLSMEGA